MEPGNKEFRPGLARFAWDRAPVIDRLGLELDALYVLVRAGDVYLPGFLTTSDGPLPAEGYTFVFASGAGIDARCSITRGDSGSRSPNSTVMPTTAAKEITDRVGRPRRPRPGCAGRHLRARGGGRHARRGVAAARPQASFLALEQGGRGGAAVAAEPSPRNFREIKGKNDAPELQNLRLFFACWPPSRPELKIAKW